MEPELAKILDDCIDRINGSSSIDVCIAEYPEVRKELEPLLYTSAAISKVSRMQPTGSFKKACKGRLIARMTEESINQSSIKLMGSLTSFLDTFAEACRCFWRYTDSFRKVALPVILTLVLTYVIILGALNIIPAVSVANGCMLTVLDGTVDVQSSEFEVSQQGVDGMTLDVGARVITAQDAKALLTFYDGSSVILEPGTEIEIREMEFIEDRSVTIVLAQSSGKTWSRVVKMVVEGSHFEIQTPSAVALVYGTYFSTEVEDEGQTTVHTIEGMVSVSAYGNEVLVTPGLATFVEIDTPPTPPLLVMSDIGSPPGNAYGLDKPRNDQGKAYGLGKPNNGQGNAFGLTRPIDDDGFNAQGNAYAYGPATNNGQVNAYGLDKPDNGQGNSYGPEANNGQGNVYAYGPEANNGQGNAYGSDKDENNKAKGQDKGSSDNNTYIIPDYMQSVTIPVLVVDPVPIADPVPVVDPVLDKKDSKGE